MRILLLLLAAAACQAAAPDYFPPPDSQGGWRTLRGAEEVRRVAGVDVAALDRAFEVCRNSSRNGGLLVVRNGWLVYERYFGKGDREATPNLASCGKSFTSIAVGILVSERPDLFPEGLDQRVFTPRYFPPEAFPLSDPAKKDIRLGQLLAMSAGIRGNNPGLVRGKPVTLDPAGPDGAEAMLDAVALGREEGKFSTKTLWCAPGEGWSYATSSIHLASIMLRHVTGAEMEPYIRERLAKPLGWGRWGFGYRRRVTHTPGGGGIALRATDMLRFCYLLLREGRWGKRQVVPAEYVRACARPTRFNPHSDYSLQFDTNGSGAVAGVPKDAYWKTGSGAHCLYVVPSLDLVIWKLAGRDAQYDPKDTGLPAPAETRPWSKDIGTVGIESRAAAVETLRRVVEAVKR